MNSPKKQSIFYTKYFVMISEVTFYAATCDNCKKEWFNDHFGWSAMNDEISILEMLSDDEWECIGDNHYCPDCYEYDDNDELIIKTKNNHETTTNHRAYISILSF